MSIEQNIIGARELDRLLQTLPVKIEKNILRSALVAGARVIAKEAKLRAPVGPPSDAGKQLYGGYAGALRDSIRTSSRIGKDGRVTASVKAGGGTKKGADVFYAHIVEFGAASHRIRPRAKKSLELGGKFVAGTVAHPGIRPQPFMRPAADAKFTEAVAAVKLKIQTRLQQYGPDVPAPVGADE